MDIFFLHEIPEVHDTLPLQRIVDIDHLYPHSILPDPAYQGNITGTNVCSVPGHIFVNILILCAKQKKKINALNVRKNQHFRNLRKG